MGTYSYKFVSVEIPPIPLIAVQVIDIPPPAPASDFSLILLDTPLPEQGEFTTSRHETQAVDALTRQALPVAVVEQAAQSAHSALAELAADSDFTPKMNLAFGQHLDATVAGDLAQDWLTGDFSELPPVEIRAGAEINGANGAFAGATNTIYLSSEFVAGNAGRPEAIVSVLLEEMGHYIDSRINTSDAAGDEGAIFAGAVQGKEFDAAELQALKAEDDTATVMLDGKAILIEQASPSDFGINLYSASYSRTGNKFVASNGTGGTYLWCTDFAFGRALEKGLVQNYSGIGGKISGNAGVWDDQAGSWGRQAQSNSFVVWDPGQGGAFGSGHVGFVERVNSDSSFVISEANFGSAQMSLNSRTITAGSNAFNTAKFVYLQQPYQPVYSIGSLSLNQTQSGSLSTTDRANPTRTGSFSDDYRLSGFSAGQQVQLNMSSTAFDSYLQLVNQSTGQVIQFDDDSGGNNNSRLTFTAQSGVNYLVRATSFGSGSTGSYSLSASWINFGIQL